MSLAIIIKRSLAIVGAICAAWICTSALFAIVMFVGDFVKTVRHDGQDAMSQMAAAFFNLPTQWIITVILLSLYSVIYITWNKELVKKWFSQFFEKFFEE
jgi:hypothetical protein